MNEEERGEKENFYDKIKQKYTNLYGMSILSLKLWRKITRKDYLGDNQCVDPIVLVLHSSKLHKLHNLHSFSLLECFTKSYQKKLFYLIILILTHKLKFKVVINFF